MDFGIRISNQGKILFWHHPAVDGKAMLNKEHVWISHATRDSGPSRAATIPADDLPPALVGNDAAPLGRGKATTTRTANAYARRARAHAELLKESSDAVVREKQQRPRGIYVQVEPMFISGTGQYPIDCNTSDALLPKQTAI